MKGNDVWVLVELPSNARTVCSKWLFKKKTNTDGVVYVFKAQLLAKGFTQAYGVDYKETLFPVEDIRAIRIVITIATYSHYEIWKMDVKTSFLNGYLSEEVYMEQPGGFLNSKYPNHVCKLKCSIYGLKQASRQWNKQFDDEIKKFDCDQNLDEPCVHLKASWSYIAILILYVDDVLLIGNNIPMLQDVRSYLRRSFAMKDLGDNAYILGIKIYRDRSKRLIGLCQSAYIEKILKRYYMENSKRGMIPMLGIVPTIKEPISMYCNSTGAIAIAKDDGVTKGARHFHAKVHYLREIIKLGDLKIEKIDIDDNLADPFTKALAFSKHSELTRIIGLFPASNSCATPTPKWELLDYGSRIARIHYEYMLNPNSGGGGGHVVDLTKYLKGWSVTGRRRRWLKMDDSGKDDKDLLETVENLMSLANGHRSSVIKGSNSNANSPPSIDKGKAVMQVQMELNDHESDSRNSDEKQLVVTYKCNKQLNKKRKKMELMNELELESGLDECKFRYSEAAQAQAISSQITSIDEAASTQMESGRIVLDFDLNEVPAIMMEDEGGDANANVNGNYYASSSYNSNMAPLVMGGFQPPTTATNIIATISMPSHATPHHRSTNIIIIVTSFTTTTMVHNRQRPDTITPVTFTTSTSPPHPPGHLHHHFVTIKRQPPHHHRLHLTTPRHHLHHLSNHATIAILPISTQPPP
nr:retrotransposon protein, putative, Ty1-copia subclass [Tanacetum cinerariifolium]